MQFFCCMFCDEDVQIEESMESRTESILPGMFQQFEVISTTPFRVQPNNGAYDEIWNNPEKQARVRRMEHRSKLDFEKEEADEEGYHQGRFAAHFEGKRNQTRKRIRGYYPYVSDDD